jgi:hypothetical protein
MKIDLGDFEFYQEMERFESSLKKYKEDIKDSNCDKHNLRFTDDNRFSCASLKINLECYKGYYGNSSCSTALAVPQDVFKKLFLEYLNENIDDILQNIIDMANHKKLNSIDSAKKKLKECLGKLEQME